MAPLKSLEKDYPMIDSNFQHFCASQGILSVEDLLIHDLDDLVALARQNSASGRLKQGITQVLSIINGLHQPWLNGMELLKDVQQNKHILSTGCERIDLFLQGGLREGYLTELVGPSSSGKTQVCLKAASNVAKAHRGGVVFLDTGNSFSPKRMAKFTISDMVNKEANQKILQEVLKSIVCHSVFDIFTLLDVLNQLKSSLMSQIGGQVQLLIVDSISSLITPVLGGSSSHGHALMISAGYLLKKMANEHNLAVLVTNHMVGEVTHAVVIAKIDRNHLKVTNHMVGGEGGISKPALGESWKSIPHVRLQLSREQGSNTFNMRLLRHPYMASDKAVTFTLP